ncbi:hypothetical protein Bcp1_128 [Bacillus phage Bcp1]|uniref:Uncharacterized protein n=1 Tax=Bacillus phage Bcp1 TaxID=584892 RepID=X2JNB1_9CAUD|nr:hypothetical protein Bcp1_128 [Bacillus phage Bcp1]AHN66603.1 hypothetical protein Bcp1_128 [Bacillus phage Bcp1]AXQ67795.1 hypothetical protein KIOSHI_135 [Bacillus phage Kioshi]
MSVMYVWDILYKQGEKVKSVTLNGINPIKVVETLQRIQYDKSKRIVVYCVDAVGHINKSTGEIVTLPLMFEGKKAKYSTK